MLPSCFLINGNLALDAGALTSVLTLQEQLEIRHILVSHAHIDHLYTLPFLLDNIFSSINTPVTLYGPGHTLESLKKHLFNDHLWPDFTSLSNDQSPILHLQTLRPYEGIEIEGMRITPAPMDHTVECFGYLLDDGSVSALIFGDTCSVDGALPLLEEAKNLQMIVLEASFPNRMARIAELSRHLTTRAFLEEVLKLPKDVRIMGTHMKPDCLGEIQIEVADLAMENVSLIEQGATYELG